MSYFDSSAEKIEFLKVQHKGRLDIENDFVHEWRIKVITDKHGICKYYPQFKTMRDTKILKWAVELSMNTISKIIGRWQKETWFGLRTQEGWGMYPAFPNEEAEFRYSSEDALRMIEQFYADLIKKRTEDTEKIEKENHEILSQIPIDAANRNNAKRISK